MSNPTADALEANNKCEFCDAVNGPNFVNGTACYQCGLWKGKKYEAVEAPKPSTAELIETEAKRLFDEATGCGLTWEQLAEEVREEWREQARPFTNEQMIAEYKRQLDKHIQWPDDAKRIRCTIAALERLQAIDSYHIHLGSMGRDPDAKVYSKRDVEALIAITNAVSAKGAKP